MKRYVCDVCGKEFGYNVTNNSYVYISPAYKTSDFYISMESNVDVCNDCHNKIAQAQNEAIKKIKEKI